MYLHYQYQKTITMECFESEASLSQQKICIELNDHVTYMMRTQKDPVKKPQNSLTLA